MNGRSEADDEGRPGPGPKIYALEIEGDQEEEIDSLMRETEGPMERNITKSSSGRARLNAVLSRNFNFRHRHNVAVARASTEDDTNRQNFIQGFLRDKIGNASSVRNFIVLGALAGCSLVLVYILNSGLWEQDYSVVRDHPHAPKLGGNMNPGFYGRPTNTDDEIVDGGGTDDDLYWYVPPDDGGDAMVPDEILPKSNVGVAVPSLSKNNADNEAGHFYHDFLKTPFASILYAANKNDPDRAKQLQEEFEKNMEQIADIYGEWVTPPWPSGLVVPTNVFNSIPNKDLPGANIPNNSWHFHSEYVGSFLQEAKALVERVKEAIYEEYGYGIKYETSTSKKNEIVKNRLEEFNVIVEKFQVNASGIAIDPVTGLRLPGIAYLTSAAWEGLIRKLLHAMVTGDEFYVVAAGRAHTYAGNNFIQSQIMQFDYIMQPVLDKLNIQLISRNMGMNTTTSIAALGGASIYGEADIFWHIEDPNAPESNFEVDLLHRQAILSGERLPVILTPNPIEIPMKTKNAAWIGNIQPGASFCDRTVSQNGKVMVPAVKACRYVNCDDELIQSGSCDRHTSICWIERSDVELHPEQAKQEKDVGYQHDGFPNQQIHRLEGRKLAMLILHALDEALDQWADQHNKGVMPLPDKMWHVSDAYDEVREKVRELDPSACDIFLRKVDPAICHMEMHAYTEWTPRVTPKQNSLKKIITSRIADLQKPLLEVYTGVDLLDSRWRPGNDEIDVHMVAISADSSHVQKGSSANEFTAEDLDILDDDVEWTFMHGDPEEDFDFGFTDDYVFGDDDFGRRLENAYSFVPNSRRKNLDFGVSGKTWTSFNAPIGFCDGSAQSTCNRHINNTCLMSNNNFYRAGILGHADSGKLSLSIPNVKEGIVLARFDWKLEDGPRVKHLPHDFQYKLTVNGETQSLDRKQFAYSAIDVVDDLRLHVLMLDKTMSQNDSKEAITVDIDIEVHSGYLGPVPMFYLTHIYYA